MTQTHQNSSIERPTDSPQVSDNMHWGNNAPKGGRTVMNRIIKDGANVPVFLAQTLTQAMRDVGYDDTTSAVCEYVDNSVQWGASNVRLYFNQRGKKGNLDVDIVVLDDGQGMNPNVLRAATAFGGSTVYDNRDGMGRYGVGMKGAGLSQAPAIHIFSWQETRAIYRMILDVDEIGRKTTNLVTLPEPEFMGNFPHEIEDILTSKMVWPKEQELFAHPEDDLYENLGPSGTLIYLPDCDRLTYTKARTLTEHAVKDLARIYRRQIANGLNLYVNNTKVQPFDPTYRLEQARHANIDEITKKQSKVVYSRHIDMPIRQRSEETAPVAVRIFKLPIEEWGTLEKRVLRNQLHLFERQTVSFVRADREVEVGHPRDLIGNFHSRYYWIRIEIDFSPIHDEAFGVNINKQGVRPKGYVVEEIKKVINEPLQDLRKWIDQYVSERATKQSSKTLSVAERRANEAEALQATLLPTPAPKTEEETRLVVEATQALAAKVKHDDETEEQAYERIKDSRYITCYKHDEDAPFYRVDFNANTGKVVLTMNTAHVFYQRLYQPLSNLANQVGLSKTTGQGDDDPTFNDEVIKDCAEAVVNLQLLLIALARTTSVLTAKDETGQLYELLEQVRKQWSLSLETLFVSQ